MSTRVRPVLVVFGILFWMSISALFTDVEVGHAATYYVAPNGSNSNPGTQAAPFATIQKAHDVANAGDTIYLRGGTYTLSSYISITKSGTSGNPIRVFNYPGETPVIDGINLTTSYHSNIQMSSASWWYFKGLEIKNAPASGIYLTGSSNNNILEFNNIHHNVRIQGSGAGLLIDGTGGNNLIFNNDSHHNSLNQTSGTGGDGIGVTYTQSGGNVVRGNRVWRNHDDGIDTWGANGVLVEGNWSWENGLDDNLQKTTGNGAGFKLGGAVAGSGNNTVRYNVSWRNGESGFDDNSGSLPSMLYNNTGWENNQPGNSNFAYYSPVANVLRNNLAENPDTVSFNAAVVHDHNSWNGGVTVTSADFVTTDFTPNTGPRKADGSLPDSNFLHLVAGSNLIDKGINVGLPYSGTAPDLGAYQFTPTTACQPTTLNTASVTSDSGFAWMTPSQASFGTTADTSAAPTVSTLRLFENAIELGPAHAPHVDIRNLGLGRFSHWSSDNNVTQSIWFSATDNTNVTTNGRTYSYTTGCTPSDTKPAAPTNLRVMNP